MLGNEARTEVPRAESVSAQVQEPQTALDIDTEPALGPLERHNLGSLGERASTRREESRRRLTPLGSRVGRTLWMRGDNSLPGAVSVPRMPKFHPAIITRTGTRPVLHVKPGNIEFSPERPAAAEPTIGSSQNIELSRLPGMPKDRVGYSRIILIARFKFSVAPMSLRGG